MPSVSWRMLRERLEQFALSLHPEKTRLIEFGRFAAEIEPATRAWQTGDVQLSGLYAYLRPIPWRDSCLSGRRGGTGCGHAASHQGGAAATNA